MRTCHQGQLDRRRHRDLVARVVVDGAAQRIFLLDQAVAQLVLQRRQAG
jgi:hypothetical protein